MAAFEEITIETVVQLPVDKVWEYWTDPDHIKKWNSASDDWHTTSAENDLRPGGKFSSRMEAKDGGMGFDFSGVYDEVKLHEVISYTLEDGRQVKATFKGHANQTEVIQTFDAETENPIDFQRQGWQAILDRFKQYAEQVNT